MIPLAERMRPKTLDEFVGQEQLLGADKPLRRMLEESVLVSMILWGPPGCGKTTLAKLIARKMKAEWFELSAVASGVKDVRAVIEKAEAMQRMGLQVLLFVDEIHRFNKSQQDELLHCVERGVLTLIGATTENPSFEVITPLLSRCRVYVLEPLGPESLRTLLHHAITHDVVLKEKNIVIPNEDYLLRLAGGDARVMFGALEIAVATAKPVEGALTLTDQIFSEVFQRKLSRYDKGGEEHYNIISAFIKSMRGGDPDAAVYYLARMLDGGEDILFIARRMVIFASEDISNANATALLLATSCFQACHQIGMPEARIILAHCATYLASSPKSNASYAALTAAMEDVRKFPNEPVPLHIRNAPTNLMKDIGYGKDYKYGHSFEGHFVEQQYLPDALKDRIYYEPSDEGQEASIKERLKHWWKSRRA